MPVRLMPKKKAPKRKAAKVAGTGAKKAKVGSKKESWTLIDKGEVGARYADPESETPCVGIDGIIQLAEDLQVEVEDPVFLVLAWEMRAETQGVFKRAEVRHRRSVATFPS